MEKEPATPTEYLASLPPEHKATMTAIHKAIRKAVPQLKPFMQSWGIGYGRYRYKYESGREGDSGVVAISSRKRGISLYLSGSDEGGYLAERNAHRLGKVDVGRVCVRFKKLEDLNLKVALELVKKAARQLKADLY